MKPWHLTLFPLLLLCGCSLQQRVEKSMVRVEESFDATKTWEELPLRTISWNQAMAMVRANNRELHRIDDNISESERNELSIYTQMIPGVTYYSYFNSNLHDLTRQVNSNQISSALNITFHIPTLTQIPYQVYATKATTFAHIKSKEGKERELTAALYKLIRNKELSDKQEAVEARLEPSQQPQSAKDIRGKLSLTTQQNWGEVAKILGNSEARWVILPETMPHVRWENYEHRLNKLDPLIVCQFAMRLEQAKMAQYSVALRYVPTINTSLYSPSLFSSSGGTYNGTFLDSRDTRLNLNVSYYLDTRMDNWNNYMRNKAHYEETKQEVAAQLMDYRNKLAVMRSSYSEYLLWRGVMQKRMDFLRNNTPESADGFLDRRKSLISMEKELISQEKQAIDTEAALIIQYGLIGN